MKLPFEKNLAIFSAKRVGNKNQPKNRTELLINKNLAICMANRFAGSRENMRIPDSQSKNRSAEVEDPGVWEAKRVAI